MSISDAKLSAILRQTGDETIWRADQDQAQPLLARARETRERAQGYRRLLGAAVLLIGLSLPVRAWLSAPTATGSLEAYRYMAQVMERQVQDDPTDMSFISVDSLAWVDSPE